MSNSSAYCIASNTDISGIGTRAATYAQNFITLIPAIHALWDGRVTRVELETLKTQSTAILVSAYGILFSTIIQAATTNTLSNFHAIIVLNLSWMNDTNSFMYFLLHLFHEMDLKKEEMNVMHMGEGARVGDTQVGRARAGFPRPTWLGSVGIWLWSDPLAFGNSPACSTSGYFFLFNQPISLLSARLRIWSLLIYFVLLVPGLNLIPTFALLFALVSVLESCPQLRQIQDRRYKKMWIAAPGIMVVTVINALLVVCTEETLGRAPAGFLEPGDSYWSFGQTLALLLLLPTARDLTYTCLNRQPRQLTAQAEEALENGEHEVALAALERGAFVGHNTFSSAIKKGSLKVVKYLAKEHPSSFPVKTALHDAVENQCLDVMEYLVEERGVDMDAKDPLGNTALEKAVQMGHLEAVQYLVRNMSDLATTAIGGPEGQAKAAYLSQVDDYLKKRSSASN
ncbi:hypothetical protein D9756_010518 [Leucocoprinus leucothites]|uniref:Uncharacterized protein n=1 Tax=Leucocoprinus leucothites TaxID=201217 RepID=A0A8H5CUJ1_9AGAR|nr:hypothetical protein D9756_010518 [Leucoagaricus leucothites]